MNYVELFLFFFLLLITESILMPKGSERTMFTCKRNLLLQFQSLFSSLHSTQPGLDVHNPNTLGWRNFIPNPNLFSAALSLNHSIVIVQNATMLLKGFILIYKILHVMLAWALPRLGTYWERWALKCCKDFSPSYVSLAALQTFLLVFCSYGEKVGWHCLPCSHFPILHSDFHSP